MYVRCRSVGGELPLANFPYTINYNKYYGENGQRTYLRVLTILLLIIYLHVWDILHDFTTCSVHSNCIF